MKSLFLLLLLALAHVSSSQGDEEQERQEGKYVAVDDAVDVVTGKIVTCPDMSLELQLLINAGEAEYYHGLQVEKLFGQRGEDQIDAELVIYHNREANDENVKPTEIVTLSKRITGAEMHELLREKGFRVKSLEEVEELQRLHRERTKEREDQNKKEHDAYRSHRAHRTQVHNYFSKKKEELQQKADRRQEL